MLCWLSEAIYAKVFEQSLSANGLSRRGAQFIASKYRLRHFKLGLRTILTTSDVKYNEKCKKTNFLKPYKVTFIEMSKNMSYILYLSEESFLLWIFNNDKKTNIYFMDYSYLSNT